MRENLSSGFAKNRGADQPAHPRSLISAFVIRLLENTIPKLAINKISIFNPVSAAEETGLNLALWETRSDKAQMILIWFQTPRQVFLRRDLFLCGRSFIESVYFTQIVII